MYQVAVPMVTNAGEEHGLINILTNSVQFDDFKSMAPAIKTKLEKEKKEDSRIVKAEYLNSRGKHERLTKPYCRYAGDPIQIWHFIPGRTYDVPLGLVKEVNGGGKMKKRSGLLSIDGEPVRKDEAPLDKDEDGDYLHRFVASGF